MKDLYREPRVGFAVGTGRCGTKFLYKVFSLEPKIASVHERNPLNETFHRYCKWYDIPVDNAGFLETKEQEIDQDLAHHTFAFESSAYLSCSIQELHQKFNAKFVLLVRAPHKVVNSYVHKGWYEHPIIRSDANKPPSYQKSKRFHHFLGRIVPSGEKFEAWQKLSRVGKIAWYWNALNAKVIEQFEKLPKDCWKVQKLEDFNHEHYLEIARLFKISSTVSKEKFENLRIARPNSFQNVPSIHFWNASEIEEFEAEVMSMSQYFGYEYRIKQLIENSALDKQHQAYREVERRSHEGNAFSKALFFLGQRLKRHRGSG